MRTPYRNPAAKLAGETMAGLAVLCAVSLGLAGVNPDSYARRADLIRRIYPQGLPELPKRETGGPSVPGFLLLDSVTSGKEAYCLFALESDKQLSDAFYQVLLSRLPAPNGKAFRLDLTDFLGTYLESPGNFSEVSGVMDFPFKTDEGVLHVNLWSRISGSGHISSGSDLFIRFREDTASILLSLQKTSDFGKEHFGKSHGKNASLYACSRDGVPGLLVTQVPFDQNNGSIKILSEENEFYPFEKGVFREPKAVPARQAEGMRSHCRPLRKSPDIVDMTANPRVGPGPR